jgi:hypothetical protein
MATTNQTLYSIPSRFRKMENLHIVFWIVKDFSWCLSWKWLGIAMIFPTLIIAVWIAWRTKAIKSELAHNLAVVFWITANSLWMVTEFLGFDEMQIWNGFTGKHLAIIPFAIGALILLYYYAIQRPAEIKKSETVTL